jgi:hypothetical protein
MARQSSLYYRIVLHNWIEKLTRRDLVPASSDDKVDLIEKIIFSRSFFLNPFLNQENNPLVPQRTGRRTQPIHYEMNLLKSLTYFQTQPKRIYLLLKFKMFDLRQSQNDIL